MRQLITVSNLLLLICTFKIFFSVHRLQVSDIKVIAAMGDAFTVSNKFNLLLYVYLPRNN